MEASMTTVALGIAISVVVILLISCAGPSKSCKKSKCRSSCEGLESGSPQLSNTGTGVLNRQLELQNQKVMQIDGYGDYNEVAQLESLDPEVIESHNEFAGSLGISNSGASALTVRSDSQDIVPRYGLRQIDYHSVYADEDARQQHTEFVDQMPVKRGFVI